MNDFTVGAVLDKLKIAAQNLKGQKVKNFNELCKQELENLRILECPLINKGSRISIDVLEFGELDVFRLIPVYREHKGRINGMSEYLDHVDVENVRDLPLNLDVDNIAQKLRYDSAAKRKNEIERKLEDMKKQIEEYEGVIKELDEIMRVERYQ